MNKLFCCWSPIGLMHGSKTTIFSLEILQAQKIPNTFGWLVEPLTVEPIAIVMRKNKHEFLKTVNGQIAEMMRSGELGKFTTSGS